MLTLLRDLITTNPFVEEVDFTDKQIQYIDQNSLQVLARFSELRKINLADNEIAKLPEDLSILAQIEELNVSGNPLENLQAAVEALSTLPHLETLQINLHLEAEVDFLLRMLPNLQILNGLPVEHEAAFSSDGESNPASSSRLQTEEGAP
jgi:Leucine-rich repeat (LRR) protein